MTINLGAAIYIALKPVLKIYTIIFVGFLLAKYNIVSMEHAKGISNMVVNALLPCLTFNKIVSNLSWHDIKEIGVLVLTALILFSFGTICALITNYTTPVPKQFFWGIIFGGLFPNISDLPIAYVQSMGNGAIFTAEEADKGVAYSCIFLFTQSFLMMNFGMWRLVGLDFKSKESDIEDGTNTTDELTFENTSVRDKNAGHNGADINSTYSNNNEVDAISNTSVLSSINSESSIDSYFAHKRTEPVQAFQMEQKIQKNSSDNSSIPVAHLATGNRAYRTASVFSSPSMLEHSKINDSNIVREMSSTIRNRHTSKLQMHPRGDSMNEMIKSYSAVEKIETGELDLTRPLTLTEDVGKRNTDIGNINGNNMDDGKINDDLSSNDGRTSSVSTNDISFTVSYKQLTKYQKFKKSISKFIEKYKLGWVVYFIVNFVRPASLGALLGIICALVPWLKALFVPTYVHVHMAPDKLPVLNFLMDFTQYIGNACIPMGLLLLGGTLGRLKINQLPKGFIRSTIMMTCFKLIISPIIGVIWANKIYKLNWLSTRIGKLVTILTWSMPNATAQVYFTAFYTPIKGRHVQMDCLSVMFLTQYIVLFISLSFVITYTLKVDLQVS